MSIKTLLCDGIRDEIDKLKKMQLGDEEYEKTVNGVTKLIGSVNDMDKLEQERKAKELDREIETDLKLKQLRDEQTDRYIRNGITIGCALLTALVTVWGTKASFEFEKEGTITTIMGRGFINKLLPKK